MPPAVPAAAAAAVAGESTSGSGVLLAAVFALTQSTLTPTQFAFAVLVLAVFALVFGALLMWIVAWLTASPIRIVRQALSRVEQGDLTTDLVVFDGTELGQLQRGFNSMVHGLRERERVRDLFGRHVGREVAALAEQEKPQLGGEERHAAVIFVDVIGSTKLVTSRPAVEVAADTPTSSLAWAVLAEGALDAGEARRRLTAIENAGFGRIVIDDAGGLVGRGGASGDAGGGEHVPLVVLTAQDQRQGLGGHGHESLGAGLAFGHLLVGDIHHVGLAALVEMGQVHLCPYRKIRWMIRVYSRDHRWVTKLHGRVRASS